MLYFSSKPLLPFILAAPLLATGCTVSFSTPGSETVTLAPSANQPVITVPSPQSSQFVPTSNPVEVARSENLMFTLVNATSTTLMEFYVSPTTTESWEEDILGANVLRAGGIVNITIADGRSTCNYDVLGVFEDDTTVEEHNVNLCQLNNGTYRLVE